MREILFRGKTFNGDWAYGDFQHFHLDDGKIIAIIDKWGESHNTVQTETVGQYTGLTDKNGTKIFEGDIINVYGVGKKEVVFHNGGFCFKLNEAYIALMQSPAYEFAYIGNIHDNPELLKEGAPQ